jgi:hypothetical protein
MTNVVQFIDYTVAITVFILLGWGVIIELFLRLANGLEAIMPQRRQP